MKEFLICYFACVVAMVSTVVVCTIYYIKGQKDLEKEAEDFIVDPLIQKIADAKKLASGIKDEALRVRAFNKLEMSSSFEEINTIADGITKILDKQKVGANGV